MSQNKLAWLFIFLLILYICQAFLYYRSEKRREIFEQQLKQIEEKQNEINKKLESLHSPLK